MDYKDLERQLKKEMKQTKVKPRKFSEVWANIQDRAPERIETPVKKPKKRLFTTLALVGASVCVAVAVPVLVYLLNPPIVYLELQDLKLVRANQTEFFSGVENIACVDFSQYAISSYQLYETENGGIKGGVVEGVDDENNPACMFSIIFADNTVKLDEEKYSDYTQTSTVNNVTIAYKQQDWDYGMTKYSVKAEYQSVTYLIDCTCMEADFLPFLTGFFS